eukprot:gene20618-23421_t
MSDIVQEVDIFGAKQITDAGVISVAQSCPMLTALGLGALPISDGALAQLTTLCPHLTQIDVSHNNTITDHGIRVIAENLSALTSINIAHCALVTDISLLHLSNHCASTLTALHMKHIRLVRVGVLLHMLKHCTHLNTLSFNFDLNLLYQTIVPSMAQLTTILVHSTLLENVISSIAKHCTKLKKFGIFKNNAVFAPSTNGSAPIGSYFSAELHAAGIEDVRVLFIPPIAPQSASPTKDAMTTTGLLALVDALPQLRCLGMNELPSELAVKLLRRLRPVLHLTDKVEDITGGFKLD